MTSYRTYLDRQGVPRGPWVVRDSRLKPLVETPLRLDAKHESDGSRSEIAKGISHD